MKSAIIAAVMLCAGPTMAAPQCQPGEIPDAACSPGVVASTDEADVCGTVNGLSYSKRHRQTPAGLKRSIFKRYGIDPDVARTQDWEVDHVVSLALGGGDVAYNLFPEPGNNLGACFTYHTKDRLEVFLWNSVCRHHTMTLSDAQAELLGDWRVSYKKHFGYTQCPAAHVE